MFQTVTKKGKSISKSLSTFTIPILLISITAMLVPSIGDNTIFGLSSVNGNSNTSNGIQKQQQIQLQHQSRTHEYTLIAQDTTVEIAPGIRVDAWTYNGTIPGPTLTATEGDRVIIHFINKTPMPHTVHLHGDHPSAEDGVFEIVPPSKITRDGKMI